MLAVASFVSRFVHHAPFLQCSDDLNLRCLIMQYVHVLSSRLLIGTLSRYLQTAKLAVIIPHVILVLVLLFTMHNPLWFCLRLDVRIYVWAKLQLAQLCVFVSRGDKYADMCADQIGHACARHTACLIV